MMLQNVKREQQISTKILSFDQKKLYMNKDSWVVYFKLGAKYFAFENDHSLILCASEDCHPWKPIPPFILHAKLCNLWECCIIWNRKLHFITWNCSPVQKQCSATTCVSMCSPAHLTHWAYTVSVTIMYIPCNLKHLKGNTAFVVRNIFLSYKPVMYTQWQALPHKIAG